MVSESIRIYLTAMYKEESENVNGGHRVIMRLIRGLLPHCHPETLLNVCRLFSAHLLSTEKKRARMRIRTVHDLLPYTLQQQRQTE